MAIELNDGRIFTGRTSPLMGACANATMNALKALAGIEDERHLLSPEVIEPIQKLKVKHLGSQNPRLHTEEMLLALSVCAASDPQAQLRGRLRNNRHSRRSHQNTRRSHRRTSRRRGWTAYSHRNSHRNSRHNRRRRSW